MNTDPQFMQLVQASSGSPTTGGNYRLQPGINPAFNAGNSALYPNTWALWDSLINTPSPSVIDTEAKYNTLVKDALENDLGGNSRFNSTIDMGAYERE
jgi:hypothetical protein